MRNTKIKFKVTTIALKEFIDDCEKEIGAITGNVYCILDYLDNCNINLSLQQIYYLTKKGKPIFSVSYKNINNLMYDWRWNKLVKRLREKQFDFHIKIERI